MENDSLENTSDKEETTDKDLSQEIDEILSRKEEETSMDDIEGLEEVVITKKELDILQKKAKGNDNYKTGLITLKGKYEKLKKESKPADTVNTNSEEKALTMNDLYRINTNKALDKAQSEDPIIAEHWPKIAKYYHPFSGKETPEAVERDIKKAKLLFLDEHPEIAEKKANKDVESDIASEKGTSSGQPKTVEKVKEKKGIIPKTTSVKDWY